MVGRFQPFHMGHFKVVQEILAEAETVIIGIGSSQYSHKPENPFTSDERHLMISRSLELEGIENFSIVPIPDIHNYPKWVAHVKSLVPSFDIVYSKSELTSKLFKEAGHEVKEPYLYDRKRYAGTEVRKRILEGNDWHSLVPEGTRLVIEEIDGISRLKDIMEEIP